MERKALNKVLAVAQNVLNECIRHKILNVLFIFAAAIIGGSFIIKELAPGAEKRALVDIGYASIELFGFLTLIISIFLTSFEEFEMRNIWITLTKPLSRTAYLIGKFLGISFALLLNISLMFILLMGLSLLNGVALDLNYLLVIVGVSLSLLVTIAFTLLFSLVSTNLPTGITFASLFFFIGHLSTHLNTLAEKSNTLPALKIVLKVIYYLLPNLSVFNLKDKVYFVDGTFNLLYIFTTTGYAVAYIVVCLIISNIAFSKKEM